MNNSKVLSALIGGGCFGIASALPYLDMANICCVFYIGGGVLGIFLYLKDRPPAAKAPYGDGAVVGVLAGLLGGIAAVVTSAIARALGYDPAAGGMAMLEQLGVSLPMEIPQPTSGMLMGAYAMTVVSSAIAATIGGLVGVAIFHKKGAPGDD